MSWALIFGIILEAIKGLIKSLPHLVRIFSDWYQRWQKRKDIKYLEERAEIRRQKTELLKQIEKATGDEKKKLIQKYLDRFIRTH